jgi:hypothetical protein
MLVMGGGTAKGQSTEWDALLSNSHWYVPQENLLSYMSSSTSFTTPPPLVLWDQTLWSLGTAVGGRFTGSSQANFFSTDLSFSNTASIVGLATDAGPPNTGQIRMRFSTSDGGTIIGIGQFREVSGTTAMQMQMISGQPGTAYTTHWAYMMPYDPSSFTPPDPVPNSDIVSTEWAWTDGTTWTLASEDLFGAGGVGNFSVTDYRNGYFWGPGTGPATTSLSNFTFLGSITPEGNVLFNVLDSSANLTSLTGLITGGPETGEMVLRTYEFDGTTAGFGIIGTATIVPEPSVFLLLLVAMAILATSRRLQHRRKL